MSPNGKGLSHRHRSNFLKRSPSSVMVRLEWSSSSSSTFSQQERKLSTYYWCTRQSLSSISWLRWSIGIPGLTSIKRETCKSLGVVPWPMGIQAGMRASVPPYMSLSSYWYSMTGITGWNKEWWWGRPLIRGPLEAWWLIKAQLISSNGFNSQRTLGLKLSECSLPHSWCLGSESVASCLGRTALTRLFMAGALGFGSLSSSSDTLGLACSFT